MLGTPYSKLPAQSRYLAMLLFADGHTSAVDLGPSTPIDAAASHLRDALANRDARFQGVARELYRLVFKPLLPFLRGTTRLFVSPDGQLALVPFAALHDGRRFLANTFDFTYLTSGRDLLPRPDGIPVSRSVVILADPDYSVSAPLVQASAMNGGVPLAAVERSYSVERFSASSARVCLSSVGCHCQALDRRRRPSIGCSRRHSSSSEPARLGNDSSTWHPQESSTSPPTVSSWRTPSPCQGVAE